MKTKKLVLGEWGGNFGVAQRILIINVDKRILALRRSEIAPSHHFGGIFLEMCTRTRKKYY